MADTPLTQVLRALFGEAHAAAPPAGYPTAPQRAAGDIWSQQLDPRTRYLFNTTPVAPPTTTTLPADAPGLQPALDPAHAEAALRLRAQGDQGTLSSVESLRLNAKQMRQLTREHLKLQRGQMRDLHSLLRKGNDPAMADTILQSLLDSGAIYEESPGQVGTTFSGARGGPRANQRFLQFLVDFSRRTGQVPMPNPYVPRELPP